MRLVYDTTRIFLQHISCNRLRHGEKEWTRDKIGVPWRRMNGSFTIPAALVPLLRRQAVRDYADSWEAAQDAAQRLLAAPDAEVEALGAELCRYRVRVLDSEDAVEALADDLAAHEDHGVELHDRYRRARIAALIDNTSAGSGDEPLRALRDELRR